MARINQKKKANAIIGACIRRARLDAKLTQAELAFHARLDPSYISRIECGFNNPTISAFLQICTCLNMEPGAFLTFIASQRGATERSEC